MQGSTAGVISHAIEPFGREVVLNLGIAHHDDVWSEVRQLFSVSGLLVFRDQKLSLDEQLDAMEHLGPVLRGDADRTDYISNVRPDGLLGDYELSFHYDNCFSEEPYRGIALHAIDVHPQSATTRFASGALALSRLDAEVVDRVNGRYGEHVWASDPSGRNRAHSDANVPRAMHPLVWDLGAPSRPFLFACYRNTRQIVGVGEAESEELLHAIFAAMYEPEGLYEHRWRNGDVVVWDNRMVQHARGLAPASAPRTLQRVTLARRGLLAQNPSFAYRHTDLATQSISDEAWRPGA